MSALPMALFVALAPGAVSADSVRLDEVEVSVPRLERPLTTTPAAVSRVDGDTVRRGRVAVQLEEALNRVPGLFFQNRYNFAQNQRISMRGFGSRAPFGVRGIRIVVDGFPETLPDGQSQLDLIDLDAVRHIEVLRGPASVLHGNASGGVIAVTTRDGSEPGPASAARVVLGAHGERKVAVRDSAEDGPWRFHAGGSLLRRAGHREQSAVRKGLLTFKGVREFGRGRALTTAVSAVALPRAEDPGGLTADEVAADREQAAPMARALDAGQAVRQQRLGLRWTDPSLLPGEVRARFHYTQRDFEQQLPFHYPGAENFIAFDRDFVGTGLEYHERVGFMGRPGRLVVGLDADHQSDNRTRESVNTDGEVTALTQDEQQRATATGLFSQLELGLAERLDLTAGLRVDRVRFAIDDRLREPADASGTRRYTEPSGSLSLASEWSPDHGVYATLSTAFETPTFVEFANPEGTGFHPDLEPQRAVNREIGARGRGGRLSYDLALFSVRVRDGIVVAEDDEERDFYENAARSRREGVELGLEHDAADALALRATWTAADYRFRRFTDDQGVDHDGNRLPGLPRHQVFLEADWRPAPLRVALEVRHVGAVYADNANATSVDGYQLANLRLGREWRGWYGQTAEVWFSVDNLLDTEYHDNVRINAAAERYYEPGPGRTARIGLEARF
ncbi:MAG: TonB-dependent receptor family protein [Pseudomonadota bacterium]